MAIRLNPAFGPRKRDIMDPVCEQEGLLFRAAERTRTVTCLRQRIVVTLRD